MRRADIEALGELAGDAVAGGGTLIREVHEGIARRPFELLGPVAAPVRVIHDGISRAVYAGAREGLRAAARGGARVAARRAPEDGPALGAAGRSAVALGALNGVYGGHLHGTVRIEMQFRRRGVEVGLDRERMAAAYPDATSRIAVFVHGLCETDEAWWLRARRSDGTRRRDYGERLQDELSFTPVYLRYNTGLPVSENGRTLARRLGELVSAWPVGVAEIVLVGHSTGGLLVRSACQYAEEEGRPWVDLVRHVFCLGRPHFGAELERGARALGWALDRLPETRPVARLLNGRSAGVRELRHGDADERGEELDLLLGDRCHEVTGVGHFESLNHPSVYEQLRAGVTGRRPAPRSLAASL